MIVNAVAERHGSEIVLLDMQEVSLLADYFVLCSAQSTPQFKAIVDEVQKEAKNAGGRLLHVEGEPESGWVLVDYGNVIVHLFAPDRRDYYRLEELWGDGKVLLRVQ